MSNQETKVTIPCEHLQAFRNARQEIQEMGVTKEGKNAHFGNTYATLDDIIKVCEPILLKHGLITTFTQTYDNVHQDLHEQYQLFCTMRITYVPTRDYFESHLTLYSDRKPQQIGSAMTYAKRYLYQNLLMITGNEDDDAEKSQQSMNTKTVSKLEHSV